MNAYWEGILDNKSSPATERYEAAKQLGQLAKDDIVIAQKLTGIINTPNVDEYPLVKEGAAEGLSFMGETAKLAVPSLFRVAEDPQSYNGPRRSSIKALLALGIHNEEIVQILIQILDDPIDLQLWETAQNGLLALEQSADDELRIKIRDALDRVTPHEQRAKAASFLNSRMSHSRTIRSREFPPALKNYHNAIVYFLTHAPLNPRPDLNILITLHKIIMQGLPLAWKKDSEKYGVKWGGLVRGSTDVVIERFAARNLPTAQVPAELERFMDWFERNYDASDPFLFAAEVYKRLIQIHPFWDGNGRAVRIFVDWVLFDKGYLLDEYKENYFNALTMTSEEISHEIKSNSRKITPGDLGYLKAEIETLGGAVTSKSATMAAFGTAAAHKMVQLDALTPTDIDVREILTKRGAWLLKKLGPIDIQIDVDSIRAQEEKKEASEAMRAEEEKASAAMTRRRLVKSAGAALAGLVIAGRMQGQSAPNERGPVWNDYTTGIKTVMIHYNHGNNGKTNPLDYSDKNQTLRKVLDALQLYQHRLMTAGNNNQLSPANIMQFQRETKRDLVGILGLQTNPSYDPDLSFTMFLFKYVVAYLAENRIAVIPFVLNSKDGKEALAVCFYFYEISEIRTIVSNDYPGKSLRIDRIKLGQEVKINGLRMDPFEKQINETVIANSAFGNIFYINDRFVNNFNKRTSVRDDVRQAAINIQLGEPAFIQGLRIQNDEKTALVYSTTQMKIGLSVRAHDLALNDWLEALTDHEINHIANSKIVNLVDFEVKAHIKQMRKNDIGWVMVFIAALEALSEKNKDNDQRARSIILDRIIDHIRSSTDFPMIIGKDNVSIMAQLYKIRDPGLRKKILDAIDHAQAAETRQIHKADFGGIDLNSANLSMMIKRDGKGVVLPLAQQDLAQLSADIGDGLEPRILSIVPANRSAVFLELVAHP